MHDCPACRVPLHGYEEVCPSCGTRQMVRRGGGSNRFSNFKAQQPGINWIPFVLVFLGVGVVILLALPGSWIGKLVTEGPPKEDPMAKVTYLDARNFLETEITKGLTNVGATGKFTWQDPNAGTPVDKSADVPVTLQIATSLPDPNMRKGIIDPVKEYMEKAKVPTLTMTDARSHATWTYNVQAAVQAPEAEE